MGEDATGSDDTYNIVVSTAGAVDFAPYDRQFAADPYPVYARLRERSPIFYSRELAMTQSTISDIERQRYIAPNIVTARRVAQFFGCTIEDVFPSAAEVV